MPFPDKNTLMRQDLSVVNSREHSELRTGSTIQLAVAAIGSDYRTLLLADEEDGLWTLPTNITTPANVTVHVPLGVTFSGVGNLTVLGGLNTWRWPVHLGPGAIIWTGSTLTSGISNVQAGSLTTTTLSVEDLAIAETITLGSAVGVSLPGDYPPDAIVDWPAQFYNQSSIGGAISLGGVLKVKHDAILTADTLATSDHSAARIVSYIDLNAGRHFIGQAQALTVIAQVAGTGGVLDAAHAITAQLYPMESSTTTVVRLVNVEGINVNTTGTVGHYTGVHIEDIEASRVSTDLFGLRARINIAGAENRYNLYVDGTARSYIAGSLGLGVVVPLFTLHHNGRLAFGVPNSAPTDGDIGVSQVSPYLNQAGNNLLFRVKYSDGTLKLGTVALV